MLVRIVGHVTILEGLLFGEDYVGDAGMVLRKSADSVLGITGDMRFLADDLVREGVVIVGNVRDSLLRIFSALRVLKVLHLLDFRVWIRACLVRKFVPVDVLVYMIGVEILHFGALVSLDLFDGALIGPARVVIVLKSPWSFADRAAKLALNYRRTAGQRSLLARSG